MDDVKFDIIFKSGIAAVSFTLPYNSGFSKNRKFAFMGKKSLTKTFNDGKLLCKNATRNTAQKIIEQVILEAKEIACH